MNKPKNIQGIRNITISGRIGSGATTLATKLAAYLGWGMLDGGKLFRKINTDLGMTITDSNKRPDHFDLEYEKRIKKILMEEKYNIIQSHLAGFDAQNIKGVFKILVITEDQNGQDKTDVRIDRLLNRDNMSVSEAKHEVAEREKQELIKFRRLYANNNSNWVYWDKKYYDLVVNTYELNKEETLKKSLETLKV